MTYSTVVLDAAKTLAPLALAGATALLGKGAQYALHAVGALKNRTVRDDLDWAIQRADTLAQQAVVAANETLVNGLKATGQWSDTAASKIFQSVLASVTANLGTHVKAILVRELPDLPAFLGQLIEAHVATAPNKMGAVAADPASSPSA